MPHRYLVVGAFAVGIVIAVCLTAGGQSPDHTAVGTHSQGLNRQAASSATGKRDREDSWEPSIEVVADLRNDFSTNEGAEGLRSRSLQANSAELVNSSRLPGADPHGATSEPAETDVGETIVGNEAKAISELPCWHLTSNLPENYYAVRQDRQEVFSGESSARIFSTSRNAQFGTLSQTINAGAFAGSRVEFSAFLKFRKVSRGVSLWVFAADTAGAITVSQRLDWIPGTLDWHSRSIAVYVPPESAVLTIAVNILGEGTLWIDDALITTVSDSVNAPSGRAGYTPIPDISELRVSARNTDFEAWDTDDQLCAAEKP